MNQIQQMESEYTMSHYYGLVITKPQGNDYSQLFEQDFIIDDEMKRVLDVFEVDPTHLFMGQFIKRTNKPIDVNDPANINAEVRSCINVGTNINYCIFDYLLKCIKSPYMGPKIYHIIEPIGLYKE